jgi:predicted phage terminase large subunit-like protein
MHSPSQPTIKINIQDSAKRTLCQRSFYDFIRVFWADVIQEPPVYNWHIEYLANELQQIGERVARREPKEYDYVIVNISPGSSKSTIASIMYPIWCWTIDKTQRFICASYAEDIALDLANKATRIITSETFKRLFPEIGMKRMSLSHMENKWGGERYTAATGSAVTGKHAHQIIIDDPLNPKKAASEIELKAANEYVSSTLSTRMVDKTITPTIVIMQRLHELDTTGYLLGKQEEGLKIKHICLPGEQSGNIKPAELASKYVDGLFDPKRLSREVLDSMKVTLGSYGYAGQVGQNPAPEGGGIFKEAWFEIVDRVNIPKHCVVKFRLDTAYTDKQKNDPSGFLAYYMDGGFMYVVHFEAVYKEFPELLKYIPIYVRRHGYGPRSIIKVEPKACFVAGTMVRTDKGMRPIEQIQVGDWVLSHDPKSGETAFKQVYDTLSFISDIIPKEIVTFTMRDGTQIKCSANHEFYVEGNWHTAGRIAGRIMGKGTGIAGAVHGVEYGAYHDNTVQEQRPKGQTKDDYASPRQVRVSQDNPADRWGSQDAQSTQGNSQSLYTQPGGQTGSQPYQREHQRQSGGELGVGNESREPGPFSEASAQRGLQERSEAQTFCSRVKQSRSADRRADSGPDKANVQTQGSHGEDAGRDIQHQQAYNQEHCASYLLEARQLSLSDIAQVAFSNEPETLYDLHVADFNTYCITDKNLIIHNSGKSVVQVLKLQPWLNILEGPVPKDDKETRAKAVSPKAEAGKVRLHRGSWNEDFLHELCTFPNAAHDEAVDLLAEAIHEELISGQEDYGFKRLRR